MRSAHRLRQVANLANGSTLLGLVLARAGGARLHRHDQGLWVAAGYRLVLPPAPAFTLGNVIVVRDGSLLQRRPALLAHEARHATQYAWCLGPGLLPLYALAAGWSWLRCGDPFSCNIFERRAGLAAGGYPPPLRRPERRIRARAPRQRS